MDVAGVDCLLEGRDGFVVEAGVGGVGGGLLEDAVHVEALGYAASLLALALLELDGRGLKLA